MDKDVERASYLNCSLSTCLPSKIIFLLPITTNSSFTIDQVTINQVTINQVTILQPAT